MIAGCEKGVASRRLGCVPNSSRVVPTGRSWTCLTGSSTSRLEVQEEGCNASVRSPTVPGSIIGDDAALDDGEATACQSTCVDARRSAD